MLLYCHAANFTKPCCYQHERLIYLRHIAFDTVMLLKFTSSAWHYHVRAAKLPSCQAAKAKKKKKKKIYICMFQVSRPYLGFWPDPKNFIVNCEQNVVRFAGKWGKIYWKMQFLYKIFWQNEMLCRPTIPSFIRSETWNKHIFFWPYLIEPTSIPLKYTGPKF